MSVDSYFCLCCLSTNDLSNLYSYDHENNYLQMLADICAVKPQDYEDDGYICVECAQVLKRTNQFKKLVLDTLNILQGNGLISINKTKDITIVTKTCHESLDEEIKYKIVSDIKTDECDEKFTPLQEDINQIIKIEDQNTRHDLNVKIEEEIKKTDCKEKSKKITQINKNLEPAYTVNDDLRCHICSAELQNVKVFHLHMNKHFPNHICEICGKGFPTEKRLKRHAPSHFKGPFKCTYCDEEFFNQNTLYSHKQRKHSTVPVYKCPYCNDRFVTLSRRARHLADVHNKLERKYRCATCNANFLLAGQLNSHYRNVHKKERRYKCDVCRAGFFHKHELQSHTSTHTGVKMYGCELCDKSYARKNALTVHMRTHKNEKRFACNECQKKFTQKITLLKHLNMHTRLRETAKLKENTEKQNTGMTNTNTEMTNRNTDMTNLNTEMTNFNTAMMNLNTEMTSGNTEMTSLNTEMTQSSELFSNDIVMKEELPTLIIGIEKNSFSYIGVVKKS